MTPSTRVWLYTIRINDGSNLIVQTTRMEGGLILDKVEMTMRQAYDYERRLISDEGSRAMLATRRPR